MLGTTPSGSVQLQDYYIHPEKMGASRKDLADAIQSYSDNDSQKIGEPFFQSLSAFASDPRRRAIKAPVITCTALSSRWRGLAASDVLAPLLTPLTSGATLQEERGTAVPGVRSPFKATVIPLVRDSHPLFPYRILAPLISRRVNDSGSPRHLRPERKRASRYARQELKIKGGLRLKRPLAGRHRRIGRSGQ